MDLTTLILFVLTFTSILILPGPNSAFAVGQSLKYGVIGSLAVPFGFMSATGLHAVLVFSGIGLIIEKYSAVFIALKWLGVLYLLFLAYKTFISKPSKLEVSPEESPKLKMFLSAMLISLTNPKALLASLMIYPLFLSPQYTYSTQAVILSLSAMAISFAVYGAYCVAASAFRSRFSGNRFANKLAGSLYLGAASVLASK